MRQIEVITHYPDDDPEFMTDYTGVTVKVDGVQVREYSDSYHGHGKEMAEGFVDGFRAAVGNDQVVVTQHKVADYPI
ncbi:hypothetical protein D3C71_24730 [compost metagenome]